MKISSRKDILSDIKVIARIEKPRMVILCALIALSVLGVLLGHYQPTCHHFFGTIAGKWTMGALGLTAGGSLLWIVWPFISHFRSHSRLAFSKQVTLKEKGYQFSSFHSEEGKSGELWCRGRAMLFLTPEESVTENLFLPT